ncbi:some similarities with Saccharomyces cerevisiae YMR112C MED11 Subunit of the RNA polymerase II mediator complex [Maudiozyma barnettii]|nr:some similarities with Saccharomyces cerevisiae YMR112C MED11 Subunit of the RNA polymerase II mediator complex [Kazachstania barnettii]
MQPEYVKERLSALDEIDLKLCGMLQEASQVVHAFSEVKSGNDSARPLFTKHVEGFYTDLESATVRLRNEIKLLDDNIGTRLLPINVNKKALGQDDEKLHEQICLLKATLSGDTYTKEVTPGLPESSSGVDRNNTASQIELNNTSEVLEVKTAKTDIPETDDAQMKVTHTEATHTEATHTEATHTEATHTEATHTEATHTEARPETTTSTTMDASQPNYIQTKETDETNKDSNNNNNDDDDDDIEMEDV